MKTLVVGAAIVDIVMTIPKLPGKGEDVLARDRKLMVGGCAYNVASMMDNFKVKNDLFVPVGRGTYASLIKKALEERQKQILIEDSSMDNGYCLCLVEDDGERTFITYQGLEANFKKDWFDRLTMSSYDKIYLPGYEIMGPSGQIIVDWLEGNKDKDLFFAPGPVIEDLDDKILSRIFKLRPVLHLNEKEALDFTGEKELKKAAEKLYGLGLKALIITLGGKGALVWDEIGMDLIEGYPSKVVDTIGAGDSHIASVMSLLSLGYDLRKSVELANRVASQMVKIKGPIMDKETFEGLKIEKFK